MTRVKITCPATVCRSTRGLHTRVGARPHAVPFDSLGTPLIPRKPPLENHQRSHADIPVFFPQKGRSRPAAAPQPENDL